jgi:pyridoxamine 5'-phosphate oxidase
MSYLRISGLERDPLDQFRRWHADFVATNPPEPAAMVVATVDADGQPWARTVLLKQYDQDGFVFFTNRESNKGMQLLASGRVALYFQWLTTSRQVQVQGRIEPTHHAEDDAYFATRARESQLGAWASQQSRPLNGRDMLEERFAQLEREYAGRDVPRPPHWGGFRIIPARYEFWQAGAHRLHDRFEYTRDGDGWFIQRLNP